MAVLRNSRIFYILFLLFVLRGEIFSQNKKLTIEDLPDYQIKHVWYILPEKDFYKGDSIMVILLPELPVYPPLKFKSKKEYIRYNKLIKNVKKTLPIAKTVNDIIEETYLTLESLPTQREKEHHIKLVEKEIKRQYTPQMKALTYSQGKLLIKLIDRECNQSSYEIVKAFFGPLKAGFYQTFAAIFGASLKKNYEPDADDKLTERVVRMVEAGTI